MTAAVRDLPSMTAPAWDRPLVAALIAAGIDLAETCSTCRLLLLEHDGPLIVGNNLPGQPRLLYGDEVCADRSALLPGDVWDGEWITDVENHGQVAA